jgi:hypothetical protein
MPKDPPPNTQAACTSVCVCSQAWLELRIARIRRQGLLGRQACAVTLRVWTGRPVQVARPAPPRAVGEVRGVARDRPTPRAHPLYRAMVPAIRPWSPRGSALCDTSVLMCHIACITRRYGCS